MPNQTYQISNSTLSLSDIRKVCIEDLEIALSDGAIEKIREGRAFLESKLSDASNTFYGINTGFGDLCNERISHDQLVALQHGLVMSHACGLGSFIPKRIIQLILLLKIKSLSFGHSGIRLSTVNRLLSLYKHKLWPVIYEMGSLGASGDLAPLAHLSLPLLGKGEVWKGDEVVAFDKVAPYLDWSDFTLEAKEGLALLNGTQFSTAYASMVLIEGERLWHLANHIAALSLDVFGCSKAPFNPLLHEIRPHKGQVVCATQILNLLTKNQDRSFGYQTVQDPYAFRCIPQVHGASYDALNYVKSTVDIEINSVTDNPNLFPQEDEILSGGNFHAQPIAIGLDVSSIALAELGSISERRTFQLLSGNRGLPPFVTRYPGLNSGLMIPQYTAASMASQNKQLCTPSSVDSIVSSNGQEDHVSMAANAGLKAYKILLNTERILAIEWMTAAQAYEFRKGQGISTGLEHLVKKYREQVSKLDEDRILYTDINQTVLFLRGMLPEYPSIL